MNTLVNPYSLNICQKVEAICAPLLKYTNVVAFLYTEIYPDGSRAEVGTHFEHLKMTYVDTDHMQKVYTPEILPDSNTIFVPEWVRSKNNVDLTAQLNNQAQYLKIGNELCLIKKEKLNYEYYHFFASVDDSSIYSFYLDKMSFLEHFCLYFRHAAAELIRGARSNRILKPWRQIKHFNITNNVSSFDHFLRETTIDRFYLDDSLTTHLTEREVQCAVELLANKSSQEIGITLNLSKRTVENYLVNIKDKLACNKKSDLINKLSELDFHYIITKP